MSGLPQDIERFIGRYIRSVEQLEILLTVRRERRAWTADALARELRIDAGSAARRLAELSADGFVRPDAESFVYEAKGELDAAVEALARVYNERRVAVISTIFSPSTDRLRSFADAFKLKGGR